MSGPKLLHARIKQHKTPSMRLKRRTKDADNKVNTCKEENGEILGGFDTKMAQDGIRHGFSARQLMNRERGGHSIDFRL